MVHMWALMINTADHAKEIIPMDQLVAIQVHDDTSTYVVVTEKRTYHVKPPLNVIDLFNTDQLQVVHRFTVEDALSFHKAEMIRIMQEKR